MKADIKILHELKRILQDRLGEDIQEVILFGSRLYGKVNKSSDYDILIITKQKPDLKQKRMISEICYDIELQHNILIDSHLISEPEMNTLRGKQPIFQKAVRKGFHV
jgi:predicted nucleotidyltransferase